MYFLKTLKFAVATLFLTTFALNIFSQDIVWKPISAEELAMKTPKVEADADAEAIFWEVRLDDKKLSKLKYEHYVRVKIFTERGREKFSKFDIPFTKNRKVEDVSARIIKPDGTIVQLNPSDIFDREIVRRGKLRIQAKSFAVPSIDVGVIVEYQYKEVVKNDSLNNERLLLQRDIPVQRLTYFIRPYEGSRLDYKFYNTQGITFNQGENKFLQGSVFNAKAFKEEPQMPPDNEARQWILLKYQSFFGNEWSRMSIGYGEFLKEQFKQTKEIKQKAAELTAGATSDEEKLRRIYDFTQKQIKNISFDRSFTDEQRENFKMKTPTDALKSGVGSSMFIDLLFGSLAKAAGFSPNLFISGNRDEYFFQPEKYTAGFIRPCCIAINLQGNWKFFNPATPYLPFGSLNWYEETVGMVVSEGSFIWKSVPITSPEFSTAKRNGKFKLLEDGTLEGTVNIEYFGHRAISRRSEDYFDSDNKREEELKAEIKELISTAEVSNLAIQNFDDHSKPLIYTYKVKVPNYAQKTGKRLFLQPSFFEHGEKPLFSSATRTHGIYFPYAWLDQDEIEISLPENYTVETSDTPVPIYDTTKMTAQNITMKFNDAKTVLNYSRNFYFGKDGILLFNVNAYQPIKTLFDSFHKADNQTITLKQK
jgi:hypothetical protein